MGTFHEKDQVYYYAARYVFADGHKTKLCNAAVFKVPGLGGESVDSFKVHILLHPDLDSPPDAEDKEDFKWAQIELFRREGGFDFFLIDRIDPNRSEHQGDIEKDDDERFWIEVGDEDKPELEPLNERQYIWPISHQSQTVARDRIVRGNLKYPVHDFDIEAGVDRDVFDDFQAEGQFLPANTVAEVFARARFKDGTESVDKFIGKEEVDFDEVSLLRVNQDGKATSEDREIKELAFYGRYRSRPGVEEHLPFNTLEIYNEEIPSITTEGDDKDDQDRPSRPHLFVGFRQIDINTFISGGDYHREIGVSDNQWNSTATTRHIVEETNYGSSLPDFDEVFPVYKEVEIVKGQPLLYKKKWSTEHLGGTPKAIYELAWWEALVRAVSERGVNVRLTDVADGSGISSEFPNSAFEDGVEFRGVKDMTSQFSNPFNVTDITFWPHDVSRVYLVAPSDSIYAGVDNTGVKNSEVAEQDGDGNMKSLAWTLAMELANLKYNKDEEPNSQIVEYSGEVFTEYDYDDSLIETAPDIAFEQQETLVYLGKKDNEEGTTDVGLPLTGFRRRIEDGFLFYELDPAGKFSQLRHVEVFEGLDRVFRNQVIWSQPFVVGAQITANREFAFQNVINTPKDHGEIVELLYRDNRVYVFTKHGLGVLNVGEVMTQQATDEVTVSTENFLTGFQWLLRNLKHVHRYTIREFEQGFFFFDGLDIWMFDGQLHNVTQGAIEAEHDIAEEELEDLEEFDLTDEEIESMYRFSGAIDPFNKEYRLTDRQQTWAYGWESQQFFGPYTYRDQVSAHLNNRMFSVNEGFAVEHNLSETFQDERFTTVIESIAQDVEDALISKIWRRFWIEVGYDAERNSLVFTYTKHHDEFEDADPVDLLNKVSRDGVRKVGVRDGQKNARQIHWRVSTDFDGFVLKGISIIFTPKPGKTV